MTKDQAEQMLYILDHDRPRPMPPAQVRILVEAIIALHEQLEAATP